MQTPNKRSFEYCASIRSYDNIVFRRSCFRDFTVDILLFHSSSFAYPDTSRTNAVFLRYELYPPPPWPDYVCSRVFWRIQPLISIQRPFVGIIALYPRRRTQMSARQPAGWRSYTALRTILDEQAWFPVFRFLFESFDIILIGNDFQMRWLRCTNCIHPYLVPGVGEEDVG